MKLRAAEESKPSEGNNCAPREYGKGKRNDRGKLDLKGVTKIAEIAA